MPQPSRRERLVRTAIELFAAEGFHAVGIERLVGEAEVSRKALYNHFDSKEELILAALETYGREFSERFRVQVEEASGTAHGRILAVFDVAGRWFGQDDFHGCMFLKAVGEYSGEDSPIRRAGRTFKLGFREMLLGLAKESGAKDPARLAEQLALLFEGAIVVAQVSGDPRPAKTARDVASTLLDAALPSPSPARRQPRAPRSRGRARA